MTSAYHIGNYSKSSKLCISRYTFNGFLVMLEEAAKSNNSLPLAPGAWGLRPSTGHSYLGALDGGSPMSPVDFKKW